MNRDSEAFFLGNMRDDFADLSDEEYQLSSIQRTSHGRHTSSSFGAPTRNNKHRERIGPMILLVELAHRIRRRLFEYSGTSSSVR